MEKNVKLESVKVTVGMAKVMSVDAIDDRDDLARVIVNFDADTSTSDNDSTLALLFAASNLASSTNRYAILVGLDGKQITVDTLQQCVGLSVECTAYRVSITGITLGKYKEVYREDGRPMANLPRCVFGKHDSENEICAEYDRAYNRLVRQIEDGDLSFAKPDLNPVHSQNANNPF